MLLTVVWQWAVGAKNSVLHTILRTGSSVVLVVSQFLTDRFRYKKRYKKGPPKPDEKCRKEAEVWNTAHLS